MARVPLITERTDELSSEQLELYDLVTASRGEVIRPFAVLAHVPSLAKPLSEVGAGIRFAGGLSDHDRELVILTVASIHDCRFEWDSHHPIAIEAGVRAEALSHLQGGPGVLTGDEAPLVEFTRQLCSNSSVTAETFDAVSDRLGDAGVVELATTIGYYTLLGFVMGAVDAC